MWKDILKGALESYTFETTVKPNRNHNTMVTYDYKDRGSDSDIEIDWYSVTVNWSMSIEVDGDGLELNQPSVQSVVVSISSIEDIGEEVEELALNLELKTSENIEVEKLDKVSMGSYIMPEADIEIGRKDGEFYIKSVDISW